MTAVRHLGVGAVVAATTAAALFGIVGEFRPERFDQKQITIAPTGDDGLRVREIVDQDFGTASDRHGYQRVIPNDFGVPTDVVASSPDAPADVSVRSSYGDTTIRVGDPDETITGQHRYVLEYTYPEAQLGTGRLGVDVIGTEDQETGRLEIVITGFQLADLECNVGDEGADGGCRFEEDGGTYRAVIEPLAAERGVTIGADIVGLAERVDVPAPPLPDRRSGSNRVPLAAAMAGTGLLTGGGIYRWARRRGRNEVAGTGAADAAFGTAPGDVTRRAGAPLPPPGTPLPAPVPIEPTGPVRLVADEDMDELATIEFVPPAGIEPWQGAVALHERIDNDTVSAWFSGLAAHGALTIERVGKTVVLRPGPHADRTTAADQQRLAELFRSSPEIRLGRYSRSFATTWRHVREMQAGWIQGSGWWTRLPPVGSTEAAAFLPILLVVVFVVMASGVGLARVLGVFGNPVIAVLAGVAFVALAALAAYRTLLPARSTTGSAVALRTESFRRFLAASEGRHVEWAWQQGLLREYSAWAVALGTAEAWERAMQQSSVAPAEYASGPILVHTMSPSFGRAHTPPSSSGGGGGGGGGFSGGSVGGGGGGGSSGSW